MDYIFQNCSAFFLAVGVDRRRSRLPSGSLGEQRLSQSPSLIRETQPVPRHFRGDAGLSFCLFISHLPFCTHNAGILVGHTAVQIQIPLVVDRGETAVRQFHSRRLAEVPVYAMRVDGIFSAPGSSVVLADDGKLTEGISDASDAAADGKDQLAGGVHHQMRRTAREMRAFPGAPRISAVRRTSRINGEVVSVYC